MTVWQLPPRPEPAMVDPDERSALAGWLDYQRATLLTKCAGLTPDQLVQRSCPPSELSLHGLVRHLAEVENAWLATFDGDPWQPLDHYLDPDDQDADLHETDPARGADDLARYRAACDRSRQVVAAHGLDDLSRDPDEVADPPTLRWVLVHLIEEYARHNGHADLLRERIDGVIGE